MNREELLYPANLDSKVAEVFQQLMQEGKI
jgi:hypothetical protein